MSIAHSEQSISDLAELLADVLALTKNHFDLPALISLLGEIKALARELPESLPELKNLQPGEASELLSAAYSLVQTVLSAALK